MQIKYTAILLSLLTALGCKEDVKETSTNGYTITYSVSLSGDSTRDEPPVRFQVQFGFSDTLMVVAKYLPVYQSNKLIFDTKFVINRNTAEFLMVNPYDSILYSGEPGMIMNRYPFENNPAYDFLESQFLKIMKKQQSDEVMLDGYKCRVIKEIIYPYDTALNTKGAEVTLWLTDELESNLQPRDIQAIYDMLFWNYGGSELAYLKQSAFNNLTVLKATISKPGELWAITSKVNTTNLDSLLHLPDYPVKPFSEIYLEAPSIN